jgi:hypothetical protein
VIRCVSLTDKMVKQNNVVGILLTPRNPAHSGLNRQSRPPIASDKQACFANVVTLVTDALAGHVAFSRRAHDSPATL